MVIWCSVFWGAAILFSTKATYHSAFPPSGHEASNYPTVSSALITCCFVSNSHPNVWKAVSHCGFCLAFKALCNQALLTDLDLIQVIFCPSLPLQPGFFRQSPIQTTPFTALKALPSFNLKCSLLSTSSTEDSPSLWIRLKTHPFLEAFPKCPTQFFNLLPYLRLPRQDCQFLWQTNTWNVNLCLLRS